MSENALLEIARQQSAAFESGTIKNQWDYFEYSVKLTLARWTALRMAMEGEWGGGDVRRKYEILLEEILSVYKYNKVVHTDAMVTNISEYVETEFGLVCEDHSIEEICELLTQLAEECKLGQYDRVKHMHEQIQSLFPIDLKSAKIRSDEGMAIPHDSLRAINEEGVMDTQEDQVDEDGFTTVRRSGRRKAAPRQYDPSVEFPGAN